MRRSLLLLVAMAAACGGKVEPEKVSTTTTFPSSSSPPPDAPALPSTPGDPAFDATSGFVGCGGTSCTLASQICCSKTTGDSCIGRDDKCDGSRIECDQPGDCPSAQPVCCLRPDTRPPLRWAATCAPSCIMNSETFEACLSDADCKETRASCTKHTCFDRPYAFCQAITQRCNP
jgi:hypothetical protein